MLRTRALRALALSWLLASCGTGDSGGADPGPDLDDGPGGAGGANAPAMTMGGRGGQPGGAGGAVAPVGGAGGTASGGGGGGGTAGGGGGPAAGAGGSGGADAGVSAPDAGAGGSAGDAGAPDVGAGGSGGGPSAPAPFDLAKALAAKPETYVRLVGFPEGPAWRKDGSLILCQPMLTRIAPDKKRYRMLSFNCLGSVVLADDSILVTGAAGLYQVLPDGKVALLADTGAANDLSVDRDGNVYFTAGGAVHRVTPEGKHDRLTGGMGANGIEVDPKNEYLYVGQAGMNQITRFALPAKDRPLGPGAVHLRVPVPDGLAFDAHGHLWVAQHKEIAVGIWDVVGKKQLGKLEVPRSAAMIQNLAFGGAKNDELYVVGGNYDANALVVRFAVGVTGFKTNPGAKAYKPVRMLGETVNERAF